MKGSQPMRTPMRGVFAAWARLIPAPDISGINA